ncbi:MAG: GGDEF domain-containing protein [Myxococcales bacterium FL481]|nr:MAG: GGDEF domain-containing protein [Myxococcales bacterium FL481]
MWAAPVLVDVVLARSTQHAGSLSPVSDDSTNKPLSIPSPPRVLAAVISAASGPEASIPRLAELVGSDPAFAVQVLKIVNSSLYSRGSKITSIDRAVSVLGTRALRNVALCAATTSCVRDRELGDFDLGRFWEDSVRRAVVGQILASRDKGYGVAPMEAFTVGLLQDIGLLALIKTHPELGGDWMEVVDQSAEARREREIDMFGQSHDEAGAALAEGWELPEELAVPMCYHHNPDKAPEPLRGACVLNHRAELIASVFTCADRGAALTRARRELHDGAGMSEGDVDQLINETSDRVKEAASTLGFDVGAQPSLEEILVQVNRGLSEMNLSYEEVVKQLEQALAEKETLTRELEARNRMLEQLSVTDALTGLPNRRAFWGRLAYDLGRTSRGGALVLFVGDVDHFKRVNDTWGHEYGDKVLQAISLALGKAVREQDLVARVGGEEFAILLPGTDRPGGHVVAKKLLSSVASTSVEDDKGEPHRFTISLGMATAVGPYTGKFDSDELAKRLYKAADAALYAAKRSGRNRAVESERAVGWTPPVAAALKVAKAS